MRLLMVKIISFIQRVRILNFLLGALCFLLIPIFFLNKGIDSYLLMQQSVGVEKNQAALEQAIDTLERFADNDYFAHHLLSQACRRADGTDKPVDSLQQEIKHLKQMFPDTFTFVVTDNQGLIIDQLSDQSSFKYLYRQAFALFAEVKQAFTRNIPVENVAEIDTRLARLSPLLGILISREDLMLPLQPGAGGKSFLVSGGAGRHHLWYFPGEKFTLISYISRAFIRGSAGLRWATNEINRNNPALLAGFARYPLCVENIFPAMNQTLQTYVLMNLGLNEDINSGLETQRQSGRIACRYLSLDYRGFCLIRETPEANFELTKYAFIAFLSKVLLVFLFVGYVFTLGKKVAGSVRFKLTILFAFSLLMPVAIIMGLALEHVNQKEKEVVAQMQAKGFRLLESIDEQFSWFMQRHADNLSSFLAEWLEEPENQSLQPRVMQSLWDKMVQRFYVQEMFFVDGDGRNYLEGISTRLSVNSRVIKKSGAETIHIFDENRLLDKTFEPDIISLMFAEEFLERNNRIIKLGMGGFEVSVFLSYLENMWQGQKRDLIAIAGWPYGKLQERFLQKYFSDPAVVADGYNLVALTIKEDRPVIGEKVKSARVNSLLKSLHSQQVSRADHVRINGRHNIAVAIKGKNLDTLALAVLIPRGPIELEIKKIRASAALLGVITLIIAFWTLVLIRRLIFTPLKELRCGIEALGAKDFRHRLQIDGNNELARLGNSFNQALETLHELEVARIVQEAFLPEKRLVLNRLQILAESFALSGLEGDYFDYFVVDDQRVSVFIGDATGHGIPAALSMAMAKAVMIDARHAWRSPWALMARLNDVFWQLRQQGGKDYMTAQTLLFNSVTGEVEIINAGHCFPVLLRKKSASVELLQARGLACGFLGEFADNSLKLQLESGDIIILYTDGFIEAMNTEGEALGFDGFLAMLASGVNDDCEIFLRRINELHRQWAKNQQDDQTMVMIRYLPDESV